MKRAGSFCGKVPKRRDIGDGVEDGASAVFESSAGLVAGCEEEARASDGVCDLSILECIANHAAIGGVEFSGLDQGLCDSDFGAGAGVVETAHLLEEGANAPGMEQRIDAILFAGCDDEHVDSGFGEESEGGFGFGEEVGGRIVCEGIDEGISHLIPVFRFESEPERFVVPANGKIEQFAMAFDGHFRHLALAQEQIDSIDGGLDVILQGPVPVPENMLRGFHGEVGSAAFCGEKTEISRWSPRGARSP